MESLGESLEAYGSPSPAEVVTRKLWGDLLPHWERAVDLAKQCDGCFNAGPVRDLRPYEIGRILPSAWKDRHEWREAYAEESRRNFEWFYAEPSRDHTRRRPVTVQIARRQVELMEQLMDALEQAGCSANEAGSLACPAEWQSLMRRFAGYWQLPRRAGTTRETLARSLAGSRIRRGRGRGASPGFFRWVVEELAKTKSSAVACPKTIGSPSIADANPLAVRPQAAHPDTLASNAAARPVSEVNTRTPPQHPDELARLPSAERLAWRGFMAAREVLEIDHEISSPKSRPATQAHWDWVREHRPELLSDKTKSVDGYDTWARYVRNARRKLHGRVRGVAPSDLTSGSWMRCLAADSHRGMS